MEPKEQMDLTIIDYEDMDDLALPDHIDWNAEQIESFTLDALDTTGWQ